MAALALIIVRFIYIGQLSWALAVPLFMYMHGYLNDVATVRNYPYPALPHASLCSTLNDFC